MVVVDVVVCLFVFVDEVEDVVGVDVYCFVFWCVVDDVFVNEFECVVVVLMVEVYVVFG